jgi:hypothetical protein
VWGWEGPGGGKGQGSRAIRGTQKAIALLEHVERVRAAREVLGGSPPQRQRQSPRRPCTTPSGQPDTLQRVFRVSTRPLLSPQPAPAAGALHMGAHCPTPAHLGSIVPVQRFNRNPCRRERVPRQAGRWLRLPPNRLACATASVLWPANSSREAQLQVKPMKARRRRPNGSCAAAPNRARARGRALLGQSPHGLCPGAATGGDGAAGQSRLLSPPLCRPPGPARHPACLRYSSVPCSRGVPRLRSVVSTALPAPSKSGAVAAA